MTVATILHEAATTDTITLAALPSDTNLVAGREGTAVNHEDGEIDSIVGGKVVTGTTPTANRQIEVWAYGSFDGTSYSGGASGADANLTPQEKSLLRLLTIIPTSNVSDQVYTWGPFSMSQAFGGTLPRKTGVFIVHNTAVNLNAAGHEVKRTPVKYVST
jgi:hypothetical protein